MLSIIVLIAVASTGCDHGTISSGTAGLHMTYSPNPSGAGRYDEAEFTIRKILALPADPAAAALYGTERLEFRFSTFEVDLASTQDVAFADIALPAGTYNITQIILTPPALIDQALDAYTDCIDGVQVLNAASPGVPDLLTFNYPATSNLSFTVSPGQTRLALTVNVPGLIQGYESAFTCQVGCGSGGTNCVTGFDTAAFNTALFDNVSIE
jgi:hypothetical protein